MKIVYILLLFLLPCFVFGQGNDSQLAYTYYQNKEYDKAADLFLKLYERTRSSDFLDYHIICLINGKEYDQAEEVLKKFLKADDSNKDFLVNLGYIYEQQGKIKKSEEYYDKAIKKLIPQSGDINNLAYKFRNIRAYGWAIQTYQRGKELLKQPDAFMSELGDNYMMERDYESMIALFIRALELKPMEINNITSKLSFARSYDIVNSVDVVIEKNLNAVLKKADYAPVFDELGVWYYLQTKNYPKALEHATLLNQKATDKLYIFLNIAQSAAEGEEYDIAANAYGKIIEKGKEKNPYYVSARKELLNCRYEKCRKQACEVIQYKRIAEDCATYMQEYGYTPENVDVVVLLSDLYAYQLQQPDSANRVLERGASIRRINSMALSMLKSKRADLLTYMDNPWEATILYTQVEKENPNNDIGYEAKLKKAWLAYYAGDLLWARAQFDVLKGATTKMIANDAIKMSHFIDMNYEEGEDNSALEKMARTEYLIYKKQDQAALLMLDSLIGNSSGDIADYATLEKAELFSRSFRYTEAAELFTRLKNESEQSYIRAEAIFELAGLKVKTKDVPGAQELYKMLVSDYSGSVYSIEAGRLYREIAKSL
ncbi:MAG: tetratricopeptide repeat protein [Odoribacter sp.]